MENKFNLRKFKNGEQVIHYSTPEQAQEIVELLEGEYGFISHHSIEEYYNVDAVKYVAYCELYKDIYLDWMTKNEEIINYEEFISKPIPVKQFKLPRQVKAVKKYQVRW